MINAIRFGSTLQNTIQPKTLNRLQVLANQVFPQIRANNTSADKDKDGWYPLHRAICRNDIEAVKQLLQMGADITLINQKDKNGWYPIRSAFQGGSDELVELLLKLEPDLTHINHELWNGAYLLHYVIEDIKRVELLLKLGADINKGRVSPLHAAISVNKYDTVQLLLKFGANVNQLDDKGDSPLQRAVYKGNVEIVKLLLGNGADKSFFYKKDHAQEWQHEGSFAGELIDRSDYPLNHAKRHGNKELIELIESSSRS